MAGLTFAVRSETAGRWRRWFKVVKKASLFVLSFIP